MLLTGFGFLTFELEDSVDLVVNEHFIQICGKQVVSATVRRTHPLVMKVYGFYIGYLL